MPKKIPLLFLVAASLWALSELFILKPGLFFVSLAVAALIIILTIKKLVGRKSPIFWPLLALSPILYYLAAAFYSAILTNQWWIQFIFLINAYAIFAYLKNIYYYFSFGAPEREAKLRKLILSFSFLAFFAAAATLYALPIFLNFSFGFIFLLLVLSGGVFFAQLMILTSHQKDSWLFLFLNTIILGELTGVLLLLPLSFNVRGILAAIFFYSLVLFNNWRLEGRLNFRHLRWPLVLSLLLIFIILFSARWR